MTAPVHASSQKSLLSLSSQVKPWHRSRYNNSRQNKELVLNATLPLANIICCRANTNGSLSSHFPLHWISFRKDEWAQGTKLTVLLLHQTAGRMGSQESKMEDVQRHARRFTRSLRYPGCGPFPPAALAQSLLHYPHQRFAFKLCMLFTPMGLSARR